MAPSPVYSKRLYTLQAPGPYVGATITVPTGHTWVVRDVQTRQSPGTTNEVLLREDSSGNTIILTVPATVNQGRSWNGHLVLEEFTQWHVQILGAGAHVTVSGYDLTSPPIGLHANVGGA